MKEIITLHRNLHLADNKRLSEINFGQEYVPKNTMVYTVQMIYGICTVLNVTSNTMFECVRKS